MQDNNIKISVIMPVYNVSEYLPRAIESVLNQSFKYFELFLVDDGSTDNSGTICDDYALKDHRIRILHQNNSGAHNARNNALKLACGDYVCFFDSDDYIDENMLNDMYNISLQYNSDLVVSGFYIHTYYNLINYITLDYIPHTTNGLEVENFSDKYSFRKNAYLNFDKNMFYPPWNKLYKLSYIKSKNITFPITYRDDFPFVLSVIKDIENVTFIKKQYYHFNRKRSDSETQKYFPNLYYKREEEHKEMLDIYNYWNLTNDYYSLEMISRRYIDRIIECIVNLFNSECKLIKNEKLITIHNYLYSKNFDEAIAIAKPKKIYLKIMYFVLLSRNINLCYYMGKFINLIKKRNIKLFSKLKTNR